MRVIGASRMRRRTCSLPYANSPTLIRGQQPHGIHWDSQGTKSHITNVRKVFRSVCPSMTRGRSIDLGIMHMFNSDQPSACLEEQGGLGDAATGHDQIGQLQPE